MNQDWKDYKGLEGFPAQRPRDVRQNPENLNFTAGILLIL